MMASPTRRRGLSERYGSWNTIWTLRRSGRSAARVAAAISSPPSRISPLLGSIRRTMQRATVDLPEPDSPTMPSVWPRRISSVTPLAARTSRRFPNQPRSEYTFDSSRVASTTGLEVSIGRPCGSIFGTAPISMRV